MTVISDIWSWRGSTDRVSITVSVQVGGKNNECFSPREPPEQCQYESSLELCCREQQHSFRILARFILLSAKSDRRWAVGLRSRYSVDPFHENTWKRLWCFIFNLSAACMCGLWSSGSQGTDAWTPSHSLYTWVHPDRKWHQTTQRAGLCLFLIASFFLCDISLWPKGSWVCTHEGSSVIHPCSYIEPEWLLRRKGLCKYMKLFWGSRKHPQNPSIRLRKSKRASFIFQ